MQRINMIDALLDVERNILGIIGSSKFKTMYIDYHKPYVSRIWYELQNGMRLHLHRSEHCEDSAEALFHPHLHPGAMRIVSGSYEMGVGYSESNFAPESYTRLLLPKGTIYEMVGPNDWHYINPVKDGAGNIGGAFSVFLTHPNKFDRQMPIIPEKKHRELSGAEIMPILFFVKKYYQDLDPKSHL